MGATLYNHQFSWLIHLWVIIRGFKIQLQQIILLLLVYELTVSYAEEMARLPGLSATKTYLKASDNYPQAENEMKEWHLEANFIGGQQLQEKYACLCKSWVNFQVKQLHACYLSQIICESLEYGMNLLVSHVGPNWVLSFPKFILKFSPISPLCKIIFDHSTVPWVAFLCIFQQWQDYFVKKVNYYGYHTL